MAADSLIRPFEESHGVAARVLTIAQRKGGAGKTTIAAQLAVAWSEAGRRVALVDIDPQASLAEWYRSRNGAGEALHLSAVAGWRLAPELDRLGGKFDVVVVDSPPHAETETKVAVRAAHLVIVPVQPSPMDLWSTRPTLAMIAKEKVPALIVLNRVPPRGRLMDKVRAALAEEKLPVAACALGNRVAFATAMMEGRAVTEREPESTAAEEVRALAREIGAKAGL
jgi:chromosome partitioning protein